MRNAVAQVKIDRRAYVYSLVGILLMLGCNDTPNPMTFTYLDPEHPRKDFSKELGSRLVNGDVADEDIVNAVFLKNPENSFFYGYYSWCPGYARFDIAPEVVRKTIAIVRNGSRNGPPDFDLDECLSIGSLYITDVNGDTACFKIHKVPNHHYLFRPVGHGKSVSFWSSDRFVRSEQVPADRWSSNSVYPTDVPLAYRNKSDEEVDAIGEERFGDYYVRARRFVNDSPNIEQYLGAAITIRPTKSGLNQVSEFNEREHGVFTFWVLGEHGSGLAKVDVNPLNSHPRNQTYGRLLILDSEHHPSGQVIPRLYPYVKN